MGIDLGNFLAKRFLFAPMEKALSRLLDNFTGNLFGGIGGGTLSAGLVGNAAGKALGGLASGLAPAASSSTPITTPASGVVNPAMALPLVAADGDVEIKKAELDKAQFSLPLFRGSRLPDAIFRDAQIAGADFEHSRYKENDFFDSTFWDVDFRVGTLDRGFFKAGWFDTAQFRKPLLDGATIKNATIEGAAGLGSTGGGIGSFFTSRIGAVAEGIGGGIVSDWIRSLIGFADGGIYQPSMGPVKVGEKGQELFFPGMSGLIMNNQMSNMFAAMQNMQLAGMFGGGGGGNINPYTAGGFGAANGGYSPYQPNAWTSGGGGVTGGGMISSLDDALIKSRLLRMQADQAAADLRSGKRQDWIQVRDLEYSAKEAELQAANGGRTPSMFTQSQYAPEWMQYNQIVKNLGAMGVGVNLESIIGEIAPSLLGQNTGQTWGGFQSTPVGTSFGGGQNAGPDYSGPATSNFSIGSSFAGGGYLPTLAAHTPGATAFSTPWNANGGSVMGGGYSGHVPIPISSSGASYSGGVINAGLRTGWFPAMANIDGRPGMTPYYLDRYKQMTSGANGGNLIQYNNVPQSFKDLGMPNANGIFTGGGTVLPFQVADSFDVRSNNSSVFGGGDFGGSRDLSNSLNPRYIGPYSPQFYNNAMNSAAIYGGLLGSGVRRYKKGGSYDKNKPFIAGDEGMSELILPAGSEGKVVPNSRIREAMGASTNVNIKVINQAPVNVETTRQIRPDGGVDVLMRIIENAARDPRHPLSRTIKQVAAGSR